MLKVTDAIGCIVIGKVEVVPVVVIGVVLVMAWDVLRIEPVVLGFVGIVLGVVGIVMGIVGIWVVVVTARATKQREIELSVAERKSSNTNYKLHE